MLLSTGFISILKESGLLDLSELIDFFRDKFVNLYSKIITIFVNLYSKIITIFEHIINILKEYRKPTPRFINPFSKKAEKLSLYKDNPLL